MNVKPWPSYIKTWAFLRTIEFKDEPGLWWWTDRNLLLRGVGKRPAEKDVDRVIFTDAQKDFAFMAGLDVKRVQSTWEHYHSDGREGLRSVEKPFFGINAFYGRIVSFWPKPVKWLVPANKKQWATSALAIEATSKQIVAIVMPMVGAETWEKS